MREINVSRIREAVSELCLDANMNMRPDIVRAMKRALKKETNRRAKHILEILLQNAEIAKREHRALCQDTGLVSVYLRLGQAVRLVGGDLRRAINRGVAEGYKRGFLRKSVVKSPLVRVNTSTNTPCIISTEIVKGDRVDVTVVPKGFGSENKSAVKMLNPTDGEREVVSFVLEVVKAAGPDACPPYIIGIGLGGTFDKAASLAKEALLLPLDTFGPPYGHWKSVKRTSNVRFECAVFEAVNRLGIGPMGLGGKTTCLGVKVLEYPTHIAGLPVAVSLGCHVTRSATRTL